MKRSIAACLLAAFILMASPISFAGDSILDGEIAALRAAKSGELAEHRDAFLARARSDAATDFAAGKHSPSALAQAAARMGLACALTDDARFAEKASDCIAALNSCEEWRKPQHARDMCDLTTASCAAGAALALHFIRDVLSAKDYAAALAGLEARAVKLYLSDCKANRWNVTNSYNWNGVVNGGMLACALLLPDAPWSPEVERNARKLLPLYLGHFAADGGWDEGANYLWYGLDNAAFAIFLAGRCGRPLEVPPAVLKSAEWCELFASPAGNMPPFGDADFAAHSSSGAGWLALASGSDAARRAFARHAKSSSPAALLYHATLGEIAPPPAPKPPERYVSPTGWAVAREDGAWLAVRGGRTAVNHSHLDLGSFVLEVGGEVVLTDPGRPLPYPYDEGYFGARRWQHPAVKTSSHSSITIGEQQQTLLAEMALSVDGAGRITGMMDGGYGKAVRRWERTWELKPHVLTIRDRVELAKDAGVTFHFVSPNEWQEASAGDWQSGGVTLRLESGEAPFSSRTRPPVLGRAYPLDIQFAPMQVHEAVWKVQW